MRTTTTLLTTIAVAIATTAVPAVGQQLAATQLKEIIVTAQKRKESFQKAPVIEMVVTGHSLHEFAIHDLKGLSQEVPSLQVGSNILNYGAQVSIRGIGNTTLNATVDQSVALNIDGMQINQGLAYAAGMFDVGQVEVLEGPQALFYGKSSIGGVIAIHTADPTDRPELIVGAGYEPVAQEQQYELIASGPVTHTLKLRIASQFSHQLGYFRNLAVGIPALGGLTPRYQHLPHTEQEILRGTALWTPFEHFDTRLKINYARRVVNGDDGDLQLTSCPAGTGPFFGIQFLSPMDDCRASRNVYVVDMNPAAYPGVGNGGVPFNDVHQIFGTLQGTYHTPAKVSITSVTGYYHLYESDLFNGINSGAAGPLFDFGTQHFYIRDVSEELRANSDFDSPLNFSVGGFFEHDSTRQTLLGRYNTFLPFPLPLLFQQGYFDLTAKTYSAFAQLRYRILPQLKVDAGVRWTHDVRDITEVNQSTAATAPGFGTPIGVIATGVPRVETSHTDPAVTVTYTPTDNLTAFASYKEASQAGGFQTTILQPAGANLSFGDETGKGFEAGVKSFLLHRRASVDVSAYRYEYSHLQVGENLVTAQGLIVRTINAGVARNYGVELSARYLPRIRGLMLRGAVDYDHARFGQFLNGPCWGGQTIAEGCNQGFNSFTGLYTSQNLRGRPLVRAPDWTMSFGFDYDRPVGSDMTFSLGSNTYFSSEYYTDLAERSDMIQKSFFKTNASVSLSGQDDLWQVSVVGVNLNDVLTTGYCANSPYQSSDLAGSFGVQTTGGTVGGVPDGLACSIDRGREVWLRLQFRPHL